MRLTTVRMIAAREITSRLASKALRISTIVVALGLLAAVVIPSLLGGDDEVAPTTGDEVATVVVVGEVTPTIERAIVVAGLTQGQRVEVAAVADRGAAAAALARDEGAVAAFVPGEGVLAPGAPTLSSSGLPGALAQTLAAASILSDAGVDPDTLAATLTAPPLPLSYLEASEGDAFTRYLIANFGAVFIYATLIMYGTWMVNGIVEEKSNRVVELLLATVRPAELMAGKVIGLGVIGVCQTLLFFLPAVMAALAVDAVELPPGALGAVGVVVAWWLLGYLVYSVVTAAAGALVSRSEEAQTVIMPITLLLVLAYFGSFAAMTDPDGTVSLIASLFPLSAPVAMAARMIVSSVPVSQVVLAVAGVLLTSAGLTVVAGRIYAGGLLKTGRRVSLRQAWSSAGD